MLHKNISQDLYITQKVQNSENYYVKCPYNENLTIYIVENKFICVNNLNSCTRTKLHPAF